MSTQVLGAGDVSSVVSLVVLRQNHDTRNQSGLIAKRSGPPSMNPPTVHSHRHPNHVCHSHHLYRGLPPPRPTPPLDQHPHHPPLMPRPPPPLPQSPEAAKLGEFGPPTFGLTFGRGKKTFGQIFSVRENNCGCSESSSFAAECVTKCVTECFLAAAACQTDCFQRATELVTQRLLSPTTGFQLLGVAWRAVCSSGGDVEWCVLEVSPVVHSAMTYSGLRPATPSHKHGLYCG